MRLFFVSSAANQRLLAHHRVRSMGNLHELLTDTDAQYHVPSAASTVAASSVAPPHQAPPPVSHYSDSDSGHGRDMERQRDGVTGRSRVRERMDGSFVIVIVCF